MENFSVGDEFAIVIKSVIEFKHNIFMRDDAFIINTVLAFDQQRGYK